MRRGQHRLNAFQRDLEANGPSLLRLIRVLLNGRQSSGEHLDRVRSRLARESAPLQTTYAGAVWTIRRYYQQHPHLKERAAQLLTDIYAEFGWKTRLLAPLIGRFVSGRLLREEKLLAAGLSYEPA